MSEDRSSVHLTSDKINHRANAIVSDSESEREHLKEVAEITGEKTAEDFPGLRKCISIFIGEFLGTAILMYVGCLCTVKFGSISSPLGDALGFGFTVCMVISIFGPISGAHINPSVTLAAILFGKLPLKMIIIYFPAQLLGCLAGFGMMKISMPWEIYSEQSDSGGICLTQPLNDTMEPYTVFLCEFLFTSCLVLTCCSLWDKPSEHLQDSCAIKFGLTVTGLSMAGGSLTGTSMNPVRSFAPAVYQSAFNLHWIYWVAPLSASIAATLFYRLVFEERRKVNQSLE